MVDFNDMFSLKLPVGITLAQKQCFWRAKISRLEKFGCTYTFANKNIAQTLDNVTICY